MDVEVAVDGPAGTLAPILRGADGTDASGAGGDGGGDGSRYLRHVSHPHRVRVPSADHSLVDVNDIRRRSAPGTIGVLAYHVHHTRYRIKHVVVWTP
jgi:hypothetical protein